MFFDNSAKHPLTAFSEYEIVDIVTKANLFVQSFHPANPVRRARAIFEMLSEAGGGTAQKGGL